MSKVVSSRTDINGNYTETVVYLNQLEDALINCARLLGRKRLWRVIHLLEKHKLGKS